MENAVNTSMEWWITGAILAFIIGVLLAMTSRTAKDDFISILTATGGVFCAVLVFCCIVQAATTPNYDCLPLAWRNLAKSMYNNANRQEVYVDLFLQNIESVPHISLLQYEEVTSCLKNRKALEKLDNFVKKNNIIDVKNDVESIKE